MKKRNKNIKDESLIKISSGIMLAIVAMFGFYIKISNPSKEVFNSVSGEFYSEAGFIPEFMIWIIILASAVGLIYFIYSLRGKRTANRKRKF